jgi:hypothetical protein
MLSGEQPFSNAEMNASIVICRIRLAFPRSPLSKVATCPSRFASCALSAAFVGLAVTMSTGCPA